VQPLRLLYVIASPRGDASYSVPVAEAFVQRYAKARPGVEVDRLDVFRDLAPFGARHAAAKMAVISGAAIPPVAAADWDQVLEVGSRVTAADILVFAVPMWNGGIPWALKLFIDIVTQPGVAFRFDPTSGYEGLLGHRRAVAVYASRVFAPGVQPAFGVDHQSTYLRWWLDFCGITEIHELRLQPTYPNVGLEERRRRAVAKAERLAARLAAVELQCRV
jgi:FMN-dependent NADH-azoreductase